MTAVRHYCTFEDREEALIGIKLLAVSLERHCRHFRLWVLLRREPDGFRTWLARHAPNARLRLFNPRGGTWNVKAEILGDFLAEHPEIRWIDSDIIVLRDLADLWARSADRLVVAQEFDLEPNTAPGQESALGARRARLLPHAVNSCVLRCVTRHRPLLQRWSALLSSAPYQAEQEKDFLARASGFKSDQDILEYVLSTSRDLAADEPVYIRTGIDIIQDHGATTYALRHRLRNALGPGRPFFVHAQGAKPWGTDYHRTESAYVEFAQDYPECLDDRLRRRRTLVRALGLRPALCAHLVGVPRCAGGRIYHFLSARPKGKP